MVTNKARRRMLLVATVTGAVAMLAPAMPASASEPADWVDPKYAGSLTDSRSIAQVAVNNATATNAGVALAQGCVSAASQPYVRENHETYTGFDVAARVWLYTNAYCDEMFKLQYWDSDDYTWYDVGQVGFTGSNNAYYVGEVRGACLRGTWAYRVSGNSWHTESLRITCADPDDPFRID